MINIGNRIKQLRTKNGLTLEELASRTELTKGFLSQLERNLVAPSLQTLDDVSEALGVTMSEFFKEESNEQIVFTKEDAFVDEQEGKTIHWIVPNAQKNLMEPILLELNPHETSQTISPHEGEEMGYVLQGSAYLCIEGEMKEMRIQKGTTFYLKGEKEHCIKNKGDKMCSILWISTPPIF